MPYNQCSPYAQCSRDDVADCAICDDPLAGDNDTGICYKCSCSTSAPATVTATVAVAEAGERRKGKNMAKTQISLRISAATKEKLTALKEKYGTATEVIAVAIDRLYQAEIAREKKDLPN